MNTAAAAAIAAYTLTAVSVAGIAGGAGLRWLQTAGDQRAQAVSGPARVGFAAAGNTAHLPVTFRSLSGPHKDP